MNQRPGVMIYFDLVPVMQYLTNEEVGILFRAIMEYGQTGIHTPVDEKLELVWPLIRHRLDSDQSRYDTTVIKRKYAAYVRWEKRNDREPMGYVQWVDSKGYERYDEVLVDALA